MLIAGFFSWWYGSGWRQVATSLGPRTRSVMASFSVDQLLRTLFQPWRRIISYPGTGLDAKLRAWADNMFSRGIGFVVRLIVLVAALVAIVLVYVVTLLEIIIWPLLPLAIPGFLIAGIIG